MRRAVLAGIVLCGVAPGAGAQELPGAAAIREHVCAAVGPEPASMQLVVTYVAHGLNGRRTTYRKGQDFRLNDEDGPFKVQSGKLAGQAWHQNANGETVLDQPDPGNAAVDPIKTTVSAVTTPVDGYVVAELNSAGTGTKDYVDRASWRVVRRELVRPTGTTVIAYDDFRTVDGYTRPWHWTSRDGHAENDAEYRVERAANRDVAAADIAIPPGSGSFIDFPVGKRRIEIPAREDRNTFFVRVTVGSRGLDFMLDTGASGIMIDEDVARDLGLKVYGRFSSAENAGRYTGGRVVLPHANIGELQLHNVVSNTIPHVGADRSGEYKAVGLLGFDFLGALAIELDYQHARVTAIDYEAFEEPKTPGTVALDVRLGTQQPMTDVTINGALGERFVLDTGSAGTLMLFDYFQRRHQAAMVDKGGGNAAERNRFYSGVGGRFETRPYQLGDVRVGSIDLKDFVAYAVRSRGAYSSNTDGLLGSEFFSFFTMWLDYAHSRVYLEPTSRTRQ